MKSEFLVWSKGACPYLPFLTRGPNFPSDNCSPHRLTSLKSPDEALVCDNARFSQLLWCLSMFYQSACVWLFLILQISVQVSAFSNFTLKDFIFILYSFASKYLNCYQTFGILTWDSKLHGVKYNKGWSKTQYLSVHKYFLNWWRKESLNVSLSVLNSSSNVNSRILHLYNKWEKL